MSRSLATIDLMDSPGRVWTTVVALSGRMTRARAQFPGSSLSLVVSKEGSSLTSVVKEVMEWNLFSLTLKVLDPLELDLVFFTLDLDDPESSEGSLSLDFERSFRRLPQGKIDLRLVLEEVDSWPLDLWKLMSEKFSPEVEALVEKIGIKCGLVIPIMSGANKDGKG